MCMTSVPVISNVRYDDMCPLGYMQFFYNVARRAIGRHQERDNFVLRRLAEKMWNNELES